MVGMGRAPWGKAAWGFGGVITGVSHELLPDEGGVIFTVTGAFIAGLRATVLIGPTATCPYPSLLGGVSTAPGADPGSGPHPVASPDGDSIECVQPQMPVGVYDVTVRQPGLPDLTLADAIEVVRRDFWTRLHELRRKFPDPPYNAVGPRRLQNELRSTQVEADGDPVPARRGLIHTVAAALLEAEATLYTTLVPPPFRFGDPVIVNSSNMVDVTQQITVTGLDLTGVERVETLNMNGANNVISAFLWSAVSHAVLSAACVGTVYVRDNTGFWPENIAIGPGFRAKATGELQAGDLVVVVDGCYRFPETGKLALAGEQVEYTSRTRTAAKNFFTLDAATPITEQHDLGSVVADFSRVSSGADLARRALLPNYAEGGHLDAVAARIGGILRPPTLLSDELFRAYYKAAAFGPLGTIHILELVFDALVGAGNYEIIEDVVTYSETLGTSGESVKTPNAPGSGWPCVVWINWGALLIGDDPRGKTFFCGGEEALATGFFTVDVTYNILEPYGVYRQVDIAAGLGRSNNLLLYHSAFPDAVVLGPGSILNSIAGNFLGSDDGKRIGLSGSTFGNENDIFVFGFLTANTGQLTYVPRTHGVVDIGAMDEFSISTEIPYSSCPFGPSSEGKTIRAIVGGAPVDRMITRYIDQRTVEVAAPWPPAAVGTGLAWGFQPVLAAGPVFTWQMKWWAGAGNTLHLARPCAGVGDPLVVDYSNVKSGIVLLDPSVWNGDPSSRYPFYLSDSNAWLRDLLKNLTVAGVHARAGDPHV